MSVHITNQIIKKEWTDYNNHMNMAYYVLVFDQVWEIMLEKFKMGESSAKTSKMSTMVVETHTTYKSEVKQGDDVEINLTFFDHDKKRLHYKMEMIEKSSKKLSATLEMLSLYIDLSKRKVSEFENEKVVLMDNFIKLNKLKLSSNFISHLFLKLIKLFWKIVKLSEVSCIRRMLSLASLLMLKKMPEFKKILLKSIIISSKLLLFWFMKVLKSKFVRFLISI